MRECNGNVAGDHCIKGGDAMTDYIKPELLILIPVLNIIGEIIKQTKINDKYIPLILVLSELFYRVFSLSDRRDFLH